jgi:hypothetical protein
MLSIIMLSVIILSAITSCNNRKVEMGIAGVIGRLDVERRGFYQTFYTFLCAKYGHFCEPIAFIQGFKWRVKMRNVNRFLHRA